MVPRLDAIRYKDGSTSSLRQQGPREEPLAHQQYQ
jgi:hypothetical protein